MMMQLADWRKKYDEAETQLRDRRRSESGSILYSSEFKEQRDENGKILMNTPEQEDELKLLTPVHNIQTLKPRMTSASASKLNFSGNL
uniref:Uncharacterized protein n=1 Tax=Ditylenchus dipsaci TaxID=166011 RepID=A0A915CU15_9BILA